MTFKKQGDGILNHERNQISQNIDSFSNFNNEDIFLDENASNISSDRIQIDEAINGHDAYDKFRKIFLNNKCSNS